MKKSDQTRFENKSAVIINGDFFEEIKQAQSYRFELAIVDGAYYRTKGDFDFTFSDFEEWQKMYDQVAKELKRVMSKTGTVIVWGHALNIAYQQIAFDKRFNLLNNAVWEKVDCQTRRLPPSQARRLVPVTERFLVYSMESEIQNRYPEYNSIFDGVRLYLYDCFESVKNRTEYKSNRAIAQLINLSSRMIDHWVNTSQWSFISEKRYTQLQNLFPDYFKKKHSELAREYQKALNGSESAKPVRRYFDNTKHHLFDVIRHRQESNITRIYDHPTQKPPSLSAMLIEKMSQPGDEVLIPFGGSGGEIEQTLRLGRKVFATEINKQYYNTIMKRINYLL